MVPLEYLHTLQDMSVIHEFEWDEHILLDAMKEVKKYQDKRNEGKLKFHIGGCLPMLSVIYMDHIDIPRGCIVDHTIDYSLPRACFVKELGFTAVIAVDTMEDGFGKRPFSSTTPYATTKFLSYIEQLAQLPNKASVSTTEIPDMVGADGAQQPTEGSGNTTDGFVNQLEDPARDGSSSKALGSKKDGRARSARLASDPSILRAMWCAMEFSHAGGGERLRASRGCFVSETDGRNWQAEPWWFEQLLRGGVAVVGGSAAVGAQCVGTATP
ncbi:hypothetical protein ZWY2020_034072 [Hordeum vulgare]|nr:hypothetical protein ZWY2020_034072 [Hordeum vulgare]